MHLLRSNAAAAAAAACVGGGGGRFITMMATPVVARPQALMATRMVAAQAPRIYWGTTGFGQPRKFASRGISCFQQPYMGSDAWGSSWGSGRVGRTLMRELMREFARGWDDSTAQSTPRELPFFVDTAEDDSAYYLWADLPAVDKDNLRITTKEQTITITANRTRPGAATQPTANDASTNPTADDAPTEEKQPALRPRRRERPFGAFRRQLTFPEDADLTAVTAKVTAGVLELTIPKLAVPEPEWREVTVA